MHLKNKIRLAGVDLDGTLLKNDKTMSEETVCAIQAAAERGIYIVPITGRPLSGIPDCVRKLNEIRYVITTNGAQITDIRAGKSIYSAPVPSREAVSLMELAEENNMQYEAFADGVGYVEAPLMQGYMDKFKNTPVGEYIISSRRVVESIKVLFEKENKCADEIFVSVKNKAELEKMLKKLRSNRNIQLCILDNRFIEITKKGTDKGEALRILCRHLNIPIENTIAFGDGDNDIPFIKAAGVSVAVANANDRIKQAADMIALSNEENGVAKILELL